MTGLYRVSLAAKRRESSAALTEIARAYSALTDKTTEYADEMFALMGLLEKVRRVWADAMDTPRPHGHKPNFRLTPARHGVQSAVGAGAERTLQAVADDGHAKMHREQGGDVEPRKDAPQ